MEIVFVCMSRFEDTSWDEERNRQSTGPNLVLFPVCFYNIKERGRSLSTTQYHDKTPLPWGPLRTKF